METCSADPAGPGLPPPAERVWNGFLAVLDPLPPDARAVLLLHDVFGMPLREIAPLLGLPVPACERRLQRVRQYLHGSMRPLEPGNP